MFVVRATLLFNFSYTMKKLAVSLKWTLFVLDIFSILLYVLLQNIISWFYFSIKSFSWSIHLYSLYEISTILITNVHMYTTFSTYNCLNRYHFILLIVIRINPFILLHYSNVTWLHNNWMKMYFNFLLLKWLLLKRQPWEKRGKDDENWEISTFPKF